LSFGEVLVAVLAEDLFEALVVFFAAGGCPNFAAAFFAALFCRGFAATLPQDFFEGFLDDAFGFAAALRMIFGMIRIY
jgi:hypothetical protein